MNELILANHYWVEMNSDSLMNWMVRRTQEQERSKEVSTADERVVGLIGAGKQVVLVEPSMLVVEAELEAGAGAEKAAASGMQDSVDYSSTVWARAALEADNMAAEVEAGAEAEQQEQADTPVAGAEQFEKSRFVAALHCDQEGVALQIQR